MEEGQADEPSFAASVARQELAPTPRAPGFGILESGASPVTEELDGRLLPPMLGSVDGAGWVSR